MIPDSHPLRAEFRKAIDFGFSHGSLDDAEVAKYIEEDVLTEFIHVDGIFKIRNSRGKRLEDIGDMLVDLQRSDRPAAKSADRERKVHKHIGDYALFVTGVFPEMLEARKGVKTDHILGNLFIHGDTFTYYLEQGKRSYRRLAEFGERLFEELSENFVSYADALTLARVYLDSLKTEDYRDAKGTMLE